MTAYRFCRATRMHVVYAVARCLQSVQNAAARLVAGTRRRYDHNHPSSSSVAFALPVRQLIHFKIAGWVSGH